mgnify:FL=1
MAKLRKMLGDVDSPECIAMMRLIETQSESTLARWALDYVESRILPIYKKKAGGDRRLDVLVQACQQVVQLHQPGKTGKSWIKEAGQIARETSDPVAQAAVRAIAAACGTLTTPTSALGFLFYATAALVYDQGLDLSSSKMEELTRQIWQDAHASLSAQSVKNEPCPAKIQWYC